MIDEAERAEFVKLAIKTGDRMFASTWTRPGLPPSKVKAAQAAYVKRFVSGATWAYVHLKTKDSK